MKTSNIKIYEGASKSRLLFHDTKRIDVIISAKWLFVREASTDDLKRLSENEKQTLETDGFVIKSGNKIITSEVSGKGEFNI